MRNAWRLHAWTAVLMCLVSRGASLPLGHPIGTGRAGFTPMWGPELGITFTNRILPSRYLTNQIPLNGSGVAAGDVNEDGRTDLFLGGLNGASALYLNRDGTSFQDASAGSELDFRGLDVTGTALVDIDGDRHLDLIANTIGKGTRILHGDGRGHFRVGQVLNPDRAGMSLAVADLDGDGDLDIYVTNYRIETVRDDPGARYRIREEGGRQRVVAYNDRPTDSPDLTGRFRMIPTGVQENGEPDLVLLNDGKGGFQPVPWGSGVFQDESGATLTSPPHDWGLSVLARDFTGDGLPDIYVCNDFASPDQFWWNVTVRGGPPRFRAAPAWAIRSTSAFSMAVDAADVNRDGHLDFFVADMLSRDPVNRLVQVAGLPPSFSQPGVWEDRPQYSRNTLFAGQGGGRFAEIARFSGVAASEWTWSSIFVDVDLDGFEDLLVSNGHEMEMMDADVSDAADARKKGKKLTRMEQLELRSLFRRFDARNAAFRNRGDFTFEDVSEKWGFAVPMVSLGMCAADLDGDGDLELIVNNINAPPLIYRNDSAASRLLVSLAGTGGNSAGIGARIDVTGGPVSQWQEMIAGGRYLSSDPGVRVFAGGTAKDLEIKVTWRSGRTTRTRAPVGSRVILDEKEALEEPPATADAARAKPAPHFEDVSGRLAHGHRESPFPDFSRQRLLSRNRSMVGPGVAWADVDGNGTLDALVGASTGETLSLFRGDGRGGFIRETNAPLSKPTGRDLTTILSAPGFLIAGSSNYKDGLTNGGVLRLYDLQRGASGDSVLGHGFSVGPLAMADVDGDGTLELFVGGRAVPGRIPEPAPSLMLQSRAGRFVVTQRWDSLGMVNGAVFSDLDGDGFPELILAMEWGPIRVFRHREGAYTEQTARLGLGAYPGFWQGVTTADVDGDGRLDILASNWGQNTEWTSPAGPWTSGDHTNRLRIYFGGENAGPDSGPYETWWDGTREWPVRRFESLVAALPLLRDRHATRQAFAKADFKAELTAVAGNLRSLEATEFRSGVFLNRKDGFEFQPFPNAAQWAPAFGITALDADGDSRVDVFLAQNFFAVHSEASRADGGEGLLLMGTGSGGFRALLPDESGIHVHGEGRGTAAGDFDADGRTDLLIGVNGSATRLYRNLRGDPGVRVVLRGPETNPTGIGCVLRLRDGEHGSPAQEIHAGSGYLGTDSPVTVVPRPTSPSARLQVVWPGGRKQEYPVPPGSAEIRAAFNPTP